MGSKGVRDGRKQDGFEELSLILFVTSVSETSDRPSEFQRGHFKSSSPFSMLPDPERDDTQGLRSSGWSGKQYVTLTFLEGASYLETIMLLGLCSYTFYDIFHSTRIFILAHLALPGLPFEERGEPELLSRVFIDYLVWLNPLMGFVGALDSI